LACGRRARALSECPAPPCEPPGRQPTRESEQDAASKEPTPERANAKTMPKRGLAEMRQRMTNACITRVKRWASCSPQPALSPCAALRNSLPFRPPSCRPAPCRWPASSTVMGTRYWGGCVPLAAARVVSLALQCLQATCRRSGQAALRLRAGRRPGAYGGGKASRVAGEGAICSPVRLCHAYVSRVPPMCTAMAAFRTSLCGLVSRAGGGARHRK